MSSSRDRLEELLNGSGTSPRLTAGLILANPDGAPLLPEAEEEWIPLLQGLRQRFEESPKTHAPALHTYLARHPASSLAALTLTRTLLNERGDLTEEALLAFMTTESGVSRIAHLVREDLSRSQALLRYNRARYHELHTALQQADEKEYYRLSAHQLREGGRIPPQAPKR